VIVGDQLVPLDLKIPMSGNFWPVHTSNFLSVDFAVTVQSNCYFIHFPVLSGSGFTALVTDWAVVGTDSSFRFVVAFLVAHARLQEPAFPFKLFT
jgi:hypothetical protein